MTENNIRVSRIVSRSKRIIRFEGAKSIINRLLIISTMMELPLELANFSSCEDVKTMQDALVKLGFSFHEQNNVIRICRSENISDNADLYIQDSAAAFRFLLTRLSAWQGGQFFLRMSPQLIRRPHQQLVEILQIMGAEIRSCNTGYQIRGKTLGGGEFDLDASVSSQFLSALLLNAPLYKKDLILNLTGIRVSAGYSEMTISILKRFGIDIQYNENRIFIEAGQKLKNLNFYELEPDFSSACYYWALGALSKDYVYTEYQPDSLQPDHGFLTILEQLGAEVKFGDGWVGLRKKQIKGIEVDMSRMPDQVPTLAVLALFAESPVLIRNISHLRYKESNRIKAIQTEFSLLGGRVDVSIDSLKIYPLKIPESKLMLNTYNDHRLVMSFTILKHLFPLISLSESDSVCKSNPLFFEDMNLIT